MLKISRQEGHRGACVPQEVSAGDRANWRWRLNATASQQPEVVRENIAPPPTHWFINFITKWHHCQLNNGLPRFACKNGLTQKSVGGHAMADSILLNALDATNTENLACLEELGGKRTNF